MSRKWPELQAGEFELTNLAEDVWRQVHPRFYRDGVVAEDAFNAREDEDRQLSCSRSAKVSAIAAFDHHTITLGLRSAGVAAIVVGDIDGFGSRVVDDESIQTAEPPTPGHCYIDFRVMSKDERSELREALAEAATDRGLAYEPSDEI